MCHFALSSLFFCFVLLEVGLHCLQSDRMSEYLTNESFYPRPYNRLEPLRIAAVPDTVLDVYMEEAAMSISAVTAALAELQATVLVALSELRSAPLAQLQSAPLSREDMAELSKDVASALSREFRVTPKIPTSPSARMSIRAASPAFSISMDDTKDHHAGDTLGIHSSPTLTGTHRHDPNNRLSKLERLFPELVPAAHTNNHNAGSSTTGSSISRSSSSSSNYRKEPPSDATRISALLARTLTKAKQGSVNSQFALAEAYKNGTDGITQSDDSALEWYTQAAIQGHIGAQVAVGDYYNDGFAVRKDFARALEWYLRAAKQGDATAQSHVGFYYRMGQGVKVDKAKAMEWFLKAANGGSQYARVHYASLKAEGGSVPPK